MRKAISAKNTQQTAISCNGVTILSVSDYAKANQNNQIIGIICCILGFLCVLFLAWVFIRAIEPIAENEGLGKIRIEYVIKGNGQVR